jgi:polyhydroxyalkanoate synthesis regulator phasin
MRSINSHARLETNQTRSLQEPNPMPDFGNMVQKALYLATYAGEKAGETFADLPNKLQQLADEMVARGEMSTEEARRAVESLLQQSEQGNADQSGDRAASEPRRIDILDAEITSETPDRLDEADIDRMRAQVEQLQAELRRLRDRAES